MLQYSWPPDIFISTGGEEEEASTPRAAPFPAAIQREENWWSFGSPSHRGLTNSHYNLLCVNRQRSVFVFSHGRKRRRGAVCDVKGQDAVRFTLMS